ncbi:hypothetical protein ILYODFUR_016521 [Ilyodon furcidens]|uniref:Uncharacterized protein n=1 Tax=Ilyodon furcidens TaxID=33524 RepID=A0ABV0VF60_9TELE
MRTWVENHCSSLRQCLNSNLDGLNREKCPLTSGSASRAACKPNKHQAKIPFHYMLLDRIRCHLSIRGHGDF